MIFDDDMTTTPVDEELEGDKAEGTAEGKGEDTEGEEKEAGEDEGM